MQTLRRALQEQMSPNVQLHDLCVHILSPYFIASNCPEQKHVNCVMSDSVGLIVVFMYVYVG